MVNRNEHFLRASKGIIIAADVPTISNLRDLAHICSQVSEVVAVKVGFSLALRYSLPSVVSAVNEVCTLPVIYDHQKAGTDIPAMGKPFTQTCSDAGVQGVIFFPQAGPKTLEAFLTAAFDFELVPIVGLAMTHPAYLKSEGGFIDDDATDSVFKISIDNGVRNFVLPGTKPDLVKKFADNPLGSIRPANIMMPGIGSQGGAITTAFEATQGHNPFAIIGSAVYNAPDPKTALAAFAVEIERWKPK
jgi:orotidine-5'-phosphate decarboxylase